MKTFFVIMAMMATMAISAQAKVVEQKIDVKDFSQIELYGSSKVIYTQGDSCSVKVRADESCMKNCEAYSDGRTLSVRYKGNNSVSIGFFDMIRYIKNGYSDEEIVFFVTSPDLTAVSLTGSGDFVSKEKVDTDNMTIILKGSGDINFQNIICDKLYGNVTGSGDLDLKRVESLACSFELKGSGDINVVQYKVKHTDLSVLGSGDISVNCNDCDIVDASVTGSGDISLSGNIKQLNKSVRGSGSIHY